MSGSAQFDTPHSRLLLPATLTWGDTKKKMVTLKAFVDSGAADNFLDIELANNLCIPYETCPSPWKVEALDGRPIGSGMIKFRTVPLHLTIENDHSETISFYLIESSKEPLILGYPWLRLHNPQFSWASGTLLCWGFACKDSCTPPASCVAGSKEILAAVEEVSACSWNNQLDLTSIPPEYYDLREVFSKKGATSLPPHRPYDCAIELLSGTLPPRSHLYSLSAPETKAMNEYIHEALRTGFIRPSTSPASAGFFFVSKKDGSLRPCIDYRGLNKITVKNRYPLPLMSSAFELLQKAKIFSKLDLRSAYNLVRIKEGDEWKTAFSTTTGHWEYQVMPFGLANAPAVFQAFINDVLREMLNRFVFVYLDDILIFSDSRQEHIDHVQQVLKKLLENHLFVKLEKCEFHVSQVSFLGYVVSQEGIQMEPRKVSAITNWPQPKTLKQVQRFLGFANFYRRFIHNFSTIAAPISALTKGSPTRIQWTAEALESSDRLKKLFSSAPILLHPDPELPFIVEVDASEVGVGAVLSQRSISDNRVHPCSFFSRSLSSAERNYDVGNRELLAVKLALEEWRHWLEGSKHPFIVWTDHKNLSYLQQAKRLNPRQARWALFFTRFNFVISYRPGSKNVKADALSRQYDCAQRNRSPELIIPKKRILAPIRRSIEDCVREALHGAYIPDEVPTGCLFVPKETRLEVLQWGHTSPLAGHSGMERTLDFVQRRFWWPEMLRDVRSFVQACPVCAQQKSSNQRPAGLLHPLPIPQRPWSHISMDFITGLPVSEGNSVVLVVVDRFSKAAHFIALPKLPSAKDTAEIVLQNVVRIHGIPVDIVTDRGPQFMSRYWRAFWSLFGSSVSLSSGFHPQSNGQTERVNQELEKYLRCFTSHQPSSWSRFLVWAELAHNTLRSSSVNSGLSHHCSSVKK